MCDIFLNDSVIKIESSQMIHDAPRYKGTPGQVLMKTNNGLIVKTLDSFLEVFVNNDDVRIRVGDKFNNK